MSMTIQSEIRSTCFSRTCACGGDLWSASGSDIASPGVTCRERRGATEATVRRGSVPEQRPRRGSGTVTHYTGICMAYALSYPASGTLVGSSDPFYKYLSGIQLLLSDIRPPGAQNTGMNRYDRILCRNGRISGEKVLHLPKAASSCHPGQAKAWKALLLA